MKKLLVGLLALTSLTAFSHDGEHKHMVRFYGFDEAGFSKSFDISFGSEKQDQDAPASDTDASTANIAINYAYNLNGTWQVGGTFRNHNDASGLDDRTIGLSAYYNLAKKVQDTCYVGLHYDIMTEEVANSSDVDTTTTIGLEYGHRFTMGTVMGMHVSYSPSLTYSMATKSFETTDADDKKTTDLAWNWIKFDVLF